jgi:hypothetical protein
MRGKARCRLHGGKSTGPKTLEGINRIRTANTKSGRWSAAGRAVARQERQWVTNGYRSARKLIPHYRLDVRFLEMASAPPPASLVAEWKDEATAAVTQTDIARLRANGFL